jgi:hypothetical protein
LNFIEQFLCYFGLKRGKDEFVFLVMPDDELNSAIAQITQTIKNYDVRLVFCVDFHFLFRLSALDMFVKCNGENDFLSFKNDLDLGFDCATDGSGYPAG